MKKSIGVEFGLREGHFTSPLPEINFSRKISGTRGRDILEVCDLAACVVCMDFGSDYDFN